MRVADVSHRIWLCEDGKDRYAKLEYVAIIWNGECFTPVGEDSFAILTHHERLVANSLLNEYRSMDHLGEMNNKLFAAGDIRGRAQALIPPGHYPFTPVGN